nr:cullin, conserved site-containing protein [Tanacetum cinerariifolium]GEY95238.1 cullin, conserved site-containing protein [Tanacetum cinerariifolium]GEY95243.1 cullin, conserved site-containing protein [Tanacetum cinerariifolium]GEY95260.1 cullin, conserved site-containing protein [Tanacetum cinerariifolium]
MFQVGSCSDMVLKALVVKFPETNKEWEMLLKHHGCWADLVQTAIGPDRQLAGGPPSSAAFLFFTAGNKREASRDIDASQIQKHGGIVELKRKEASKFTGTMSTQKSGKGSLLMSKDCGSVKDLSVVSFLKTHASSQTAMTAFKKAEESKDYADRLKISGFDYECNDAYFDSALKFVHAASLLEAYYNDFRKLKGMVDPFSVYSTAAKHSK